MGIKANITTNKIEVAAQGRQGIQGLTGATGATGPQGPVGDLDDQLQVVYVSKVGNDSNSGLNFGQAKLTITAAITIASGMTPSESNQVAIQIVDSGNYAESFTLPEWVHIDGLKAGIDGTIDIDDNCIVRVRRLSNTGTGECISKLNGPGLSNVIADIMIVSAVGNEGIAVKNGQLACSITTVSVTGGSGFLVRAGSRLVFDVQYMRLNSSGRGFLTSTTGGTGNVINGNILLVDDDGTGRFIRTVVDGDVLDIQGGSFLVNQLYDLGLNSILNLFAHITTGSRSAVASAQINIVDTSGDSNLQGDLNVEGALTGPTVTGIDDRLEVLENEPPFTVSQPSDLDAFKSGGVYTLPVDNYNFTQDMSFGTDRIVVATVNGCTKFSGVCLPIITYTGTGSFISSSVAGSIIEVDDMFFSAPNGKAIEMSDGSSLILGQVVFLSCLMAADLDNIGFLTINTCAVILCDAGIMANDVGVISARLPQFNNNQDVGGSYMTLTGAASKSLIMSTIDSEPEGTESFLDIQASYGGDVAIGVGVHHIEVGSGSFFSASGRDQNDIDIQVSDVKNVTSSKSTAAIHIAPGSETATTISDGVETIIAGTYTEDIAQRFTTTAAGRLTYTGKETNVFGFAMKCLGVPTSGNNRDYSFYIRHTAFIGTVETLIPISFDPINADAGTPAKVISIGDIELSTGDFLEPIVIGVGNSINVTCSGLAFIVGP